VGLLKKCEEQEQRSHERLFSRLVSVATASTKPNTDFRRSGLCIIHGALISEIAAGSNRVNRLSVACRPPNLHRPLRAINCIMKKKPAGSFLHLCLLLDLISCAIILSTLSTTRTSAQHMTAVVGLRVEYAINPAGIDSPKPRFSWQLQDEQRGIVQTGYQIQVARTEQELHASRLIWDSGTVTSAESSQRAYEGPSLQSTRQYYWHVRVWDGTGQAFPWTSHHIGKWVCCDPQTGKRVGSNPH
jgi:hypothetical protein